MFKIIPLSAASDLLVASVLWFFGYRLVLFNREGASKFSLFFQKMILLVAAGMTFYGLGFGLWAKNPLAMGIVNVIGEIPINLGMTYMIAAWASLQFPNLPSEKVVKIGVVVTLTQAILHLLFWNFPIILPPYGIRDFNAHPLPGTFMALYNATALLPAAAVFGIRAWKGESKSVRRRSFLLALASILMSTAGILDGFTLNIFFRILSSILYLVGSPLLFLGIIYRQREPES